MSYMNTQKQTLYLVLNHFKTIFLAKAGLELVTLPPQASRVPLHLVLNHFPHSISLLSLRLRLSLILLFKLRYS